MLINLKGKSSSEILRIFEALHVKGGEIVEAELLLSDIEYFGYKTFADLAQLFFMRLLMPIKKDEQTTVLRFQKLHANSSFHKSEDKSSEKYGAESDFFTIDKTKEFSFLYHYQKVLEFTDIKSKKRVLNLGVNRGDEFAVIKEMLAAAEFADIEFVGIDYCASAIEHARKEFLHDENVEFICHDINQLKELNLERFDLIVSIGTLQSSNIEFNSTFMSR